MKDISVDQYCRKVGKKLICTKETRENLLNGIREELADRKNATEDSMEDIEVVLGNADRMVEILQAEVSKDEVINVRKKRKTMLWSFMGLGFCILILCVTVLVKYIAEGHVWYVKTVIVYEGEKDAEEDKDLNGIVWGD